MKWLVSMKWLYLTALLSASFPMAVMAAERTVLIGYAAPLSGASGSVGTSLVQAAELAVEDINRQDIQIDGEHLRFQLLTQNDRSDPRTGLLVADYFVKSNVVGVIGHWNSGVGIPASRIYKDAGIVQIAQATTSHAYTQQGFATAFRIVPHDDEGARYTAQYVVRQMKGKRIAVLDDQTLFGAGYADQFAQTVRELKGELVNRQSISSHTSDFNAVLRALKQADPDLVFFGGLDAQAAQLVRELRRFDISAPLVGAGGTVGQRYLQLAGTAGEGTVALEPGYPAHQGAQWQQFEKNYKSRFGDDMGLYAPFSYDAIEVLAAAIKQARSLERGKILAAMHRIRHNGLTGQISFDAEGNLINPVFTVFQVKNQKWLPLKTIGGKS